MKAFTSQSYTVPIGNHSYPMAKYRLIPERLKRTGILRSEELIEPQSITIEDVLLVHTRTYVNRFINGLLERKELLRLGLPWSEQLVQRVFSVLGGTAQAITTAFEEGISINLAGGTHHAFADHGEGYCVFNDFVVGLRRTQQQRDLVTLIIDLDVHQGNGTAVLCKDDPRTFTFSMHGMRNYPSRKEESSLDVSLPDNTTDEQYSRQLESILPQLFEQTKPDLVMYQAGVDVLKSDRFGKLALTMQGIADRDRFVMETARQAHVPLVAALGGGYAPNIEEIVTAHCQTVQIAAEICKLY